MQFIHEPYVEIQMKASKNLKGNLLSSWRNVKIELLKMAKIMENSDEIFAIQRIILSWNCPEARFCEPSSDLPAKL